MQSTVWHWHKNKHIDQWARLESPDIILHIHSKLIFMKSTKNIQRRKDSLQKMGWRKLDIHKRKMKLNPCLIPLS